MARSTDDREYLRCTFRDLAEGDLFVLERRNRHEGSPVYRKVSAWTAAPLAGGTEEPFLDDKVVFKSLADPAYDRCVFSELRPGDLFVLERRSRGEPPPLYRKVSDVHAVGFPDGAAVHLRPEKVVFRRSP